MINIVGFIHSLTLSFPMYMVYSPQRDWKKKTIIVVATQDSLCMLQINLIKTGFRKPPEMERDDKILYLKDIVTQ